MTDTIFALSSGNPPAAIAVVRISGSRADAALQALIGTDLPSPRKTHLRTLRWNGQTLDSALILRFPGPSSATGDDLVELHLHGGRAVVAAVLDALVAQPGLRPAEPGEFTRRAFENGRIDLAQAEGLSDLLRAETEHQRRAAMMLAEGGLTRIVDDLRRALLDASARVEAAIDFDDEDDVQPWPERTAVLGELAAQVDVHLSNPPAERLHDGIRVAIAGPPNAGKSSLINSLSSRDAAIVSPMAGTTRDVIEVPVRLRGLPLILTDTAGLRDQTDDSVEAIGIDRATRIVGAADVIVWLGDPAEVPDRPHVIAVRPKADLAPAGHHDARLAVSAHTGEGLAGLLDRIEAEATALLPKPDTFALNQRQRACLADLSAELHNAAATSDLLLAAEHLRHGRAVLDRLTGKAGVEEMLDALFGTFCIGK
jgi:tRNA modification GTPase